MEALLGSPAGQGGAERPDEALLQVNTGEPGVFDLLQGGAVGDKVEDTLLGAFREEMKQMETTDQPKRRKVLKIHLLSEDRSKMLCFQGADGSIKVLIQNQQYQQDLAGPAAHLLAPAQTRAGRRSPRVRSETPIS